MSTSTRTQSWRNRPKVMSPETVAWTAARLAEHAKAHRLDEVRVVLHGGEPLLAGPERPGQIARTLREALSSGCELDLRIHTNGVLLDEAFARVFADEGVLVGISVDGYAEAHDRHRRFADGPGQLPAGGAGGEPAADGAVPAPVRGPAVHDRPGQ